MNKRYRVTVTVSLQKSAEGGGWGEAHEVTSAVEGSLTTARELGLGALVASMCREGMEAIAPRPVIFPAHENVPGAGPA